MIENETIIENVQTLESSLSYFWFLGLKDVISEYNSVTKFDFLELVILHSELITL